MWQALPGPTMLEPEMTPSVRQPAVAGRFYPNDPERLEDIVQKSLAAPEVEPVEARMLMAPHAGYVYSGAIAGATYARVLVPATAVVLCPNHTGQGDRRSLWSGGAWSFPGFSLKVDAELAASIADHAALHPDTLAHLREHAVEVQLPFLRARRRDVMVVPVCLGRLSAPECRDVGVGIARALRERERASGESVLLVASSDMSHYLPADTARRLDMLALERVLQLDPDGLHALVEREDLSMCGYVPTAVGLWAARELGASSAELVCYGNSGEVSGDLSEVVGYAGVVVR